MTHSERSAQYDRPVVKDVAELRRRLDAGEWLLVGEVALVLGIGRATAHRLVADGAIKYKLRPGTGQYRECDPADVRAQLAARTEIHGGDGSGGRQQ